MAVDRSTMAFLNLVWGGVWKIGNIRNPPIASPIFANLARNNSFCLAKKTSVQVHFVYGKYRKMLLLCGLGRGLDLAICPCQKCTSANKRQSAYSSAAWDIDLTWRYMASRSVPGPSHNVKSGGRQTLCSCGWWPKSWVRIIRRLE
jgi:hypothetical protein